MRNIGNTWPLARDNAGAAGFVANGNLVNTINTTPGPQPPAYVGFEPANTAVSFDGTTHDWASFNNPSSLDLTGQITLEAWVQPGATQGEVARIISHGPQTISSYLAYMGTVDPAGSDFLGATTNTTEVFLRIDGTGANYTVGSAQYDNGTGVTTTYAATYPVPPVTSVGPPGCIWSHL